MSNGCSITDTRSNQPARARCRTRHDGPVLTAKLADVGFAALGAEPPEPPDEIVRHAHALQALAEHKRALHGAGVRARRQDTSMGPAADSIAQHVEGDNGLLARTARHTHTVSLAASVTHTMGAIENWAYRNLWKIAALAGLAVTVSGAAVTAWPRIKQIYHAMARGVRICRQIIGRIFTRLTERLRTLSTRQAGSSAIEPVKRTNVISAQERQAILRRQPPGPLERDMPLPRPADLRFERDSKGLIVAVNDKPTRNFVEDMAQARSSEYLARREKASDLAFSNTKAGPVYTLLMDRRTGKLYEGLNNMLRRVPEDLHPLLRERYEKFAGWARGKGPFTHDEGWPAGEFPHWSEPGTHSEVTATSKALWDRTLNGETVTSGTLRDFYFDNRLLSNHYQGIVARQRIPCCANCTHFLYDTPNSVGYFTKYPSMGDTPLADFTPPWAT